MAVKLTPEQSVIYDSLTDFILAPNAECNVLHGLAGTGKTTVLAKIALEFPQAMLVTLTGKAASVLRRKTGLPVMTIHSAFYRLREEQKQKNGKNKLIFDPSHDDGALSNAIVLLDECSMVNERMANDIFATGAKVIACGDPGQLPPVEGDTYFRHPDFELQTIHRQALESPIIRQAHRVRSGEGYVADGDAFRVVSPGDLNADEKLQADVILCWTNRTRNAINQHIRNLRGFGIQPHPQADEPVMCLKNAPDFGLFNGAVYTLLEPFMEGDKNIVIQVDRSRVVVPNVTFAGLRGAIPNCVEPTTAFDFGYAMTVHKAQGSEWGNVILIDEYKRSDQRREWLYTAITRAADKITIVR